VICVTLQRFLPQIRGFGFRKSVPAAIGLGLAARAEMAGRGPGLNSASSGVQMTGGFAPPDGSSQPSALCASMCSVRDRP
jgi:hypothetical protein